MPLPIMEMPRETRIICVLRGAVTEKVERKRRCDDVSGAVYARALLLVQQSTVWKPLAWVALRLYDYEGRMNVGQRLVGMWMVRFGD